MMVGLRKFFSVEKATSPRRPHTGHGEVSPADMSQLDRIDSHSYAHSTVCSSPMTPTFPPELRSPRMLDMGNHFAGIERQFEELHGQLHSRPMSAISHCPSDSRSTFTAKTARHVDLVEAVFSSSHRHHLSSKSLSPTRLYNEDVADRNILRKPKKKPKRSRYARILSALYQEDVADRNIASRGSSASYAESRRSCNSSETEATTRATSLASSQGWDRVSSKLTVPGKNNSRTLVTSSQEDLRQNRYSVGEDSVGHGQGPRRTPTESLRSQNSAPNLVSKKLNPLRNDTGFSESNLLEVPGAFKYGQRMSNVPLPDSPTLPELRCHKPVAINSIDSNRQHGLQSLEASRAASKKNVRDLRINTQLASGRGPVKKIEHRAIQPPTPSQHLGAQSPSIAEIVNSPLPAATPSSISSPRSTYNAEEIMNMFRRAYVPTRADTPNPTFETLQDAIIREINSHEAFLRVPVPDVGPPFTPPPTEDEFLPTPEAQTPATSHRNLSEKESHFTKLIRRGSQGRKTRSKSISSLIHLTSYDKFVKRPETSGRRRRHTYAERPSTSLINTMYPDQPPREEGCGGSVPYQTMLRGLSDSQVPLRLGPKTKSESDLKRTPDQVPAARSGSRNASNMLQSRPSVVRRMRAQTLVSDSNDETFFIDDDPDDIIELPHVELRPVQIKSVDDNNVTYFFNATAPVAPQESMSQWRTTPQKGSSDGKFSRKQPISFPFSLNRKRIPLRRSSLDKDTPTSRRMVW